MKSLDRIIERPLKNLISKRKLSCAYENIIRDFSFWVIMPNTKIADSGLEIFKETYSSHLWGHWRSLPDAYCVRIDMVNEGVASLARGSQCVRRRRSLG